MLVYQSVIIDIKISEALTVDDFINITAGFHIKELVIINNIIKVQRSIHRVSQHWLNKSYFC